MAIAHNAQWTQKPLVKTNNTAIRAASLPYSEKYTHKQTCTQGTHREKFEPIEGRNSGDSYDTGFEKTALLSQNARV